MKTYRFGIIGCGLMGREFGSAVARWCHLTGLDFRPEIVAVCDANPAMMAWFQDNFASVAQATEDYHELLANPAVDCVYCAVPHNLHQQFYCHIGGGGGSTCSGEKPFGIDKAANDAINACLAAHPEIFVRCSSEFSLLPAHAASGAG